MLIETQDSVVFDSIIIAKGEIGVKFWNSNSNKIFKENLEIFLNSLKNGAKHYEGCDGRNHEIDTMALVYKTSTTKNIKQYLNFLDDEKDDEYYARIEKVVIDIDNERKANKGTHYCLNEIAIFAKDGFIHYLDCFGCAVAMNPSSEFTKNINDKKLDSFRSAYFKRFSNINLKYMGFTFYSKMS